MVKFEISHNHYFFEDDVLLEFMDQRYKAKHNAPEAEAKRSRKEQDAIDN